ncbi:MAG: divergent polysaccharide deacetylase family protein, partial [bacterium]|nr:divergent polysaccharide deacetylase family protein [bacterium]
RNGMVVGICHPHANTVAVLQKEIPELVGRGIRFVTLSEMFALQGATVPD